MRGNKRNTKRTKKKIIKEIIARTYLLKILIGIQKSTRKFMIPSKYQKKFYSFYIFE